MLVSRSPALKETGKSAGKPSSLPVVGLGNLTLVKTALPLNICPGGPGDHGAVLSANLLGFLLFVCFVFIITSKTDYSEAIDLL